MPHALGGEDDRTFRVPRNLLPESDAERDLILQSYFCELLATSHLRDDSWDIKVQRPPSAEFYVDPRLAEGLRWWDRVMCPVNLVEIPVAYEYREGFQLSFSDAWTLFSWSEYIQRASHDASGRLTVLHVDDHRDLMPPRLVHSQGGLIDLLTGQPFDLAKPATVASAIRSGAVGMGSFVAPLLGYGPAIDFRHLCASANQDRARFSMLSPVSLTDSLLARGLSRPSFALRPVEAGDGRGKNRYLGTSHLQTWLDQIGNNPILLHVDMDYFNNRYDGDSDRANGTYKYDPPLADVISRIDSLFSVMEENGITERICDCSISLSPGFFPAEFWEPSINRISKNIESLRAEGVWGAIFVK